VHMCMHSARLPSLTQACSAGGALCSRPAPPPYPPPARAVSPLDPLPPTPPHPARTWKVVPPSGTGWKSENWGLNISRDMTWYHSRVTPPASTPSSPVNTTLQVEARQGGVACKSQERRAKASKPPGRPGPPAARRMRVQQPDVPAGGARPPPPRTSPHLSLARISSVERMRSW
jgi:hypothetical protein